MAAAHVCAGSLTAPAAICWERVVALTDSLLDALPTSHAARPPLQPTGKSTMHCNRKNDAVCNVLVRRILSD